MTIRLGDDGFSTSQSSPLSAPSLPNQIDGTKSANFGDFHLLLYFFAMI